MLALSLSCVAAEEVPDYMRLKSARAVWHSSAKDKTLSIQLETRQEVPMDGKAGAFGFAALTRDTNNVLVLVTHLPIDDSSYEQTPSGFHTHVLDLRAPTPACKGATFEVDLEGSGKNRAFDADYAWSITRDAISIKNIPVADLGDAGVERIASFQVAPVLDEQGKAANLCIQVMEQI
ncbi:hypothetical protein [Methylogaea oryzae]|uniref:hypothetical protein n=1 Tax=Methylogaea oryzae TaxID=1295382 RepID=UPI001C81D125|nr:hypothetical protein [Methylogaea oryzae]